MTSKNNPNREERTGQQSQSQTDQQQFVALLDPEFKKYLGELTRALENQNQLLQSQIQSQTPKPFEGAAKDAVDVFNDIIAGLQLKFPPVPPNLEAKAVSSTDVELKWTDDTNNAGGFKIRRCQGGGGQDFAEIKQVSSNVRAYQDVNLSSQTTYRYQLIAFNFRGETLSNTAEATTEKDRKEINYV